MLHECIDGCHKNVAVIERVAVVRKVAAKQGVS